MALTWIVSKVSSLQVQPKKWNIVLNLKLSDDAVEVVNQDISVDYVQGDDIDNKRAEILEKMQMLINKHKAEQVIFDHAKMDSLVTYLNDNLVV